MTKAVKTTKQAKLLAHLQRGNSITFNQVKGTFGIANPSDAVTQLRLKGNMVYANKVTLKDGRVTTSYRIGTPSKAFLAAAFAAQYAA